MAKRTLPILFINLGGEMLYILDQRLRAQAIGSEKAGMVMNDIVSTMFNRRFIEEIFQKHQPIYSRRVLKTMFDKLAHASIMRLNSSSMDKLYDLMTMAVKHQVLMSLNPQHIVSITLNHLDAILGYATTGPVRSNVELAFRHTVSSYGSMAVGELQAVRHSILNFLQDIHVRVTMFLQQGVQSPEDGAFMMPPNAVLSPGVEPPGTIRLMDPATGEVAETLKFPPGQLYDIEPGLLGMQIGGKRSTQLGINNYARSGPAAGVVEAVRRDLAETGRTLARGEDSGLAREELNLLAKLIGTETDARRRETFRLNLFDGELGEEEEEAAESRLAKDPTLRIDLKSGRSRGELDRIISEMTVAEEDGEEEDLLALMDKAL